MSDKSSPPIDASEVNTQGMRSVVRMLGFLFNSLRVAIVLCLICLVFGGMFYVKNDEEGMLFHFGRLTAREGQEVLKSGRLYWAWPYPIDVLKRIPAQKSVTLQCVQFWPKLDPNKLQQLQGQAAPPPPAGGPGSGLKPGDDGYLVTGDANIMHMIWTLTYRVTDPKRYYLQYFEDPSGPGGTDVPWKDRRGVDKLIESVLADVVLNVVGTWNVDDVFRKSGLVSVPGADGGARQESLSGAVRQRVVERLAKAELDVGIEVQQVSLVEVQPPVASQQAFREVFAAAAENQAEVEKALGYQKKVVTEAEGTAAQVLAEARAYKTRVTESVKASKSYFEKVLSEYQKNPKTMLVALYSDTIREVLTKAESRYILHDRGDGQQEIRLMLGPEPDKPRSATVMPGDAAAH